MHLSQHDLRRIVAQATPLAERLSADFHADAAPADDQRVQARLKRWRQVVALGDQEQWKARLAWDGLDESTVQPLLGTIRLRDDSPLPAWATTFASVAAASVSPERSAHRFLKPEAPFPFEELLVPFVAVAQQKVTAQAGASYQLLSETAHASLERSLLRHLAILCAQTLELEFSLFRSSRQSLSRLFGGVGGEPPNEQYQAFIERMRDTQLPAFWSEYSVLARLTATATNLWAAATIELLERLSTDWPTLERMFGGDIALGQVTAVSSSLSDPHNHGRTVIGLTFESGLNLIYKPKDLGLDLAFMDLLAWCNARGLPLPLKLLQVLNCSGYGWVEYIAHEPCRSAAEAQRFYQRAGMLLCLVYALQGTDCHNENLIACGEHPVLIDMEMLLQAQVRGEQAPTQAETTARLLAHQQLRDSVLRTGLLPRWEFGPDGRGTYDISGLGSVDDQAMPIRVPRWKGINTDAMTLSYELGTMAAQKNAPALDGVTLSPNDYLDDLEAGFRQMYGFLVEHRAALRDPSGPLTALAQQQVRFVFRATKAYALVLNKVLAPNFLRDGADQSIELDILSRWLLAAGSPTHCWSLLRAELQALEQRDIPFFAAPAESTALPLDPNQAIEHFFSESGSARLQARLDQLSVENLDQQIGTIRSSFHARIARGVRLEARDLKSETNTKQLQAASLKSQVSSNLSQDELVHQAIAIAHDLQQRAIRAPDGSSSWIGMEYVTRAGRFQLEPLGDDLYNGCSGIALFLAALKHVTSDTGYRDLALAALLPFRKLLQAPDSTALHLLAKRIGVGGAVGLGGIVYTLVRASQFLDEPSLLDDARKAAALITPEDIAADGTGDLIDGSAGAILGLLALYRCAPDADTLERAIRCGRHLLGIRVRSAGGYRSWANGEGELLAGCAHGAAGIAYALLRLYAITGDCDVKAAAQEAIAYERSIFSPEAGWPDYRGVAKRDGKPGFGTTWCNGAAGVGLARIGGLPMLDTDAVRADIATAVQLTLRASLAGADHLCCGTFGRIELLLVAATRLERQDLQAAAQQQAAYVADQARQTGCFNLFHDLPRGVYNPGLFQGTAGIGYELLRLAHPDTLPSVLLWE